MARPGFEQFDHTVIVSAFFASHMPSDRILEMEITHRHCVRVTQGCGGDQGRSPWADPTNALQPSADLCWGSLLEACESRHLARHPQQDLGTFAFDANRVQVAIPELGESLR